MPFFTVTVPKTAMNTGRDLCHIAASATKPLRVYIIDIKGLGTASADNDVVVSRSTGGDPTGMTTVTPSKLNSNQAAASFSAYRDSGSNPTSSASLSETLWRLGVNANGGIDKFVAPPGLEFQIPVSGKLSVRSAAGTSSVSLNLLIEEVDG